MREVFSSLQNNTFSREDLNDENGIAQNIHYGDVLIKYDECLDVSKENLDYIDKTSVINKFQKSFLKNGDVVVADTAEDETVGKCTEIQEISKEKIISGLHTMPLRPVQKFGIGYLGFYMNSNSYHDQLKPLMQGIKVTSISKSAMANTIMKYPANFNEQQKIGVCFQLLNAIITLHQRKLEKLKNFKKAMLEKMFPKNGEKTPEIRFQGFTDDWEQRKLENIVEFLDTQRKPLTESMREKGPYPYYGASGIVDYVAGYIFDEELILLSEDGANITERNYPVCFLASGKYWVNNHAHVLRARPQMDNNFICMSLEQKDYSNYNTGMAMPKLNQDTCRQIPVIYPSSKEQQKIGNYFRKIDTFITLHQRKLEKLQQIKKAMLEKMFV